MYNCPVPSKCWSLQPPLVLVPSWWKGRGRVYLAAAFVNMRNNSCFAKYAAPREAWYEQPSGAVEPMEDSLARAEAPVKLEPVVTLPVRPQAGGSGGEAAPSGDRKLSPVTTLPTVGAGSPSAAPQPSSSQGVVTASEERQ